MFAGHTVVLLVLSCRGSIMRIVIYMDPVGCALY